MVVSSREIVVKVVSSIVRKCVLFIELCMVEESVCILLMVICVLMLWMMLCIRDLSVIGLLLVCISSLRVSIGCVLFWVCGVKKVIIGLVDRVWK